MQWMIRRCFGLLLLGLAVGCGPADQVKVYPVKGTVKFQGQPMKGGGSIAFYPTGGQVGATPGGEIKEDGTYELMTYKPGDGSMPGDYRVVITQVTVKEPIASPDGSAPLVVQEITARNGGRMIIHCVAVGNFTTDTRFIEFLTQLAQRNGGQVAASAGIRP